MQLTQIPVYLSLLLLIITQGSSSDGVTPMTVVGWAAGTVVLPCAPQKRDPSYSSRTGTCWYYEGQPIWNCGSLGKFSGRLTTSNNHNLHISNLHKTDSGLYVYVKDDGLVWKVNLTVIDDSTTSAADLQFVVGVKGRSVVLSCFASYPGKSFAKSGCWYHDDIDIHCWGSTASSYRFRPRLTELVNNNVLLSNLSVSDSGSYTCQRSPSERGQLKLIVKAVPLSRPKITRLPDREDEALRGSGDPRHSLSFSSAQVGESGEYRCVASNEAEGKTWSHSATVRLTVQSPIVDILLTLEPQRLFTFEGQPLVLRCRVHAGSEPISWTWFWVPGGEGSGSRKVGAGERDLWLGGEGQSGQYSCQAQNQYNGANITLDSKTVTVYIVPKPGPHLLVWVALALGGCALLVLIFLYCRRHTWTGPTHALERAAPAKRDTTELKTMPDPLKPPPKRRGYEVSTNHYQEHKSQDDFYCPLSEDHRVEEAVYDDLS
ncbi:hypothetical protein AAFF_G00429740 [Aldrovandia affinis]|uniref:Soluble interferon alpha/beta receptor OPG204 n=1 Tax=Aldrovandia affinis TaxID=143900 RepID=A0AAD7WIQ2_9TELE|nr:hypothetical protein AAFF_G00429740 [Aldrovandia affinis]